MTCPHAPEEAWRRTRGEMRAERDTCLSVSSGAASARRTAWAAELYCGAILRPEWQTAPRGAFEDAGVLLANSLTLVIDTVPDRTCVLSQQKTKHREWDAAQRNTAGGRDSRIPSKCYFFFKFEHWGPCFNIWIKWKMFLWNTDS